MLFLTGCFWDGGHLYREDQPSPAPGLRCLNWLAAEGGRGSPPEPSECPPGRRAGLEGGGQRSLTSLLSASGSGNHNYCRNPDQDPRGPWCYISSDTGVPEKRLCEDVRCPGTRPGPRARGRQPPRREAAAVAPASHVRPHDARPAPSHPRAVRLVRAISRPRSPKLIGRRGIRSELILREHL